MSHRSREAQALLDAARPDEDPRETDRTRIRGAVLARIAAAGAATAVTATAAQAGAGAALGAGGAGVGSALAGAVGAGAMGLAGKVTIGLLVVAGFAGGALGMNALRAPSGADVPARVAVASETRSVAAPVRAAARAESKPTAGAVEGAEAPSDAVATVDNASNAVAGNASAGSAHAGSANIAGTASGAPERSAQAVTGAAMPSEAAAAKRSELDAESALLRRAQTELSAGHTDEALRLLAEHERSFANGALGEERAAGRVLALCQAGRVAEARALAAQFLRDKPGSPLAGRVRAACAEK